MNHLHSIYFKYTRFVHFLVKSVSLMFQSIDLMKNEIIQIFGAREHNLKDIDLEIPRKKLVVITGLSGSGKSSLAFDTIYAEGQRRYIETFSAYARQFLGALERPDVDKIEGLSPVIAIEQKTTSKNPRSTVGTITEIYDFLRLLYARASTAYSYNTKEKMIQYSEDQIKELILQEYKGKRILILAPVVRSRKGHYRELFEQINKQGFVKVRTNGTIQEIVKNMKLDRYKTHDIEIVIDQLKINLEANNLKRLEESIQTALYHGEDTMIILDYESNEVRYFSQNLMCPTTGISYALPEPNTFSFNSPKGACEKCNGLGKMFEIDLDKLVPNSKISIKRGGIIALGEYKRSWIFQQIEIIGKRYDFTLETPIYKIPKKALESILYGIKEEFEIESKTLGVKQKYKLDFEGVAQFIESQFKEKNSAKITRWAKDFMEEKICSECHGSRLKKESLHFKIDGKSIGEASGMDLENLSKWLYDIEARLEGKQRAIGSEILKELRERLQFLLNVGLHYLTLNRSSKTLSGGEAQRIRLATQIGSQLVNVLYILDEPSIGLHQRDNSKLIESLKNLRDIGNSILVVEHDKDMIEQADYVIDIGPEAGKNGGEIVSKGTPDEILKTQTLTASYLNHKRTIEIPENRRKGNGFSLKLKGATGNNLQYVNLELPLGKIVCVTGVSGSGKSTLINETLYPVLNNHFYKNGVMEALPYKKIEGLEHLDKVIDIDQSPIGRTPRSNPATYTGVFGEIRTLFSKTPESKIRGYKLGRFSFNVKGGRCETCQGSGMHVIEMNFLPDIHVHCETCQGKRFNRETLEIRYKEKSIYDVLEMTIDEAVLFFEAIPKIYRKIKTLQDVGLGYITLGQPSTTLSGGEAQRVKLATELSKIATGKTLYILDEPTTGLHFEDIRVLLGVLQQLVNKGNSIVIIEHNLDVIKVADWIIDIGPDGGVKGGQIIAKGTPEQIIKNKKSITGVFLKKEMDNFYKK